MYRTLHPTKAEYPFSSSVRGIFCMIYRILGHKTSLVKFKGIQMIQGVLSDDKGIKLEIDNRFLEKNSQNKIK